MVEPTVDPLVWLGKHLEEADTDLLREMVRTFIQALMGAEADAVCGALYGERSPDRVNRRNGEISIVAPECRRQGNPTDRVGLGRSEDQVRAYLCEGLLDDEPSTQKVDRAPPALPPLSPVIES